MPNFYQDKSGYQNDYQYPDPSVLKIIEAGQGVKPPYSSKTTWYVCFDDDPNQENAYIEKHDIEAQAPKLLLDSGRVPLRYQGLRLNRIRAEWCANQTVRVDLEYGLPAYKSGTDGWRREFNVSSRSIHIDRTRFRTDPGTGGQGQDINFGDLVGVSEDGIAGADIDDAVGNYVMSTSYAPDHPLSVNTINIREKLGKYVNCINNAPFEGFAAKELRLGPGTAIKQDEHGTTHITLNFQYSRNETFSMNIWRTDKNEPYQVTKTYNKGGWDYFWTFCKSNMIDLGGVMMNVLQPFGGYISPVYYTANFNQLIKDLS